MDAIAEEEKPVAMETVAEAGRKSTDADVEDTAPSVSVNSVSASAAVGTHFVAHAAEQTDSVSLSVTDEVEIVHDTVAENGESVAETADSEAEDENTSFSDAHSDMEEGEVSSSSSQSESESESESEYESDESADTEIPDMSEESSYYAAQEETVDNTGEMVLTH